MCASDACPLTRACARTAFPPPPAARSIVFVLRNHTGQIIASAMTPPIMIMDDHKAALARSKVLASDTATGPPMPGVGSELRARVVTPSPLLQESPGSLGNAAAACSLWAGAHADVRWS